MTKKCAVCGTECAADALSCAFCGEASFEAAVAAPKHEPTRKSIKPPKPSGGK